MKTLNVIATSVLIATLGNGSVAQNTTATPPTAACKPGDPSCTTLPPAGDVVNLAFIAPAAAAFGLLTAAAAGGNVSNSTVSTTSTE